MGILMWFSKPTELTLRPEWGGSVGEWIAKARGEVANNRPRVGWSTPLAARATAGGPQQVRGKGGGRQELLVQSILTHTRSVWSLSTPTECRTVAIGSVFLFVCAHTHTHVFLFLSVLWHCRSYDKKGIRCQECRSWGLRGLGPWKHVCLTP